MAVRFIFNYVPFKSWKSQNPTGTIAEECNLNYTALHFEFNKNSLLQSKFLVFLPVVALPVYRLSYKSFYSTSIMQVLICSNNYNKILKGNETQE